MASASTLRRIEQLERAVAKTTVQHAPVPGMEQFETPQVRDRQYQREVVLALSLLQSSAELRKFANISARRTWKRKRKRALGSISQFVLITPELLQQRIDERVARYRGLFPRPLVEDNKTATTNIYTENAFTILTLKKHGMY